MGGLKAKKLRRLAESRTTGMPKVAYQKIRHGISKKKLRKLSGNKLKELIHGSTAQAILHPDCTRYVYQKLKKIA